MNIIINDRTCTAETGDRLLDVARANHAHIGYFCGGNGICQTCYVKVLEGSELLSPISETEKAMLSDRLIEEGTRMACLTNIEKPGTVKILSAIEEVKEMYETNPLLLPAYSAKMGWDALIKFPETVALQIERTVQGKFDILQIVRDIIGGIADAVQLALTGFQPASSGEATDDSARIDIEVKPSTEHHQSSVLPG
jgi:chlorosome envelope protein X